MNTLKSKLTSRKFLLAITGVISGIMLLVNDNVTEGVATIISSVVAYLVAEGIVDAAAVKTTTDKIEDAIVLDGFIVEDGEETTDPEEE